VAAKRYYVDSCVWLNLFKKEGDAVKGEPYWRSAESFLERVMFSDDEILYSGFVLKELRHVLDNETEFAERLEFLRQEPTFTFAKATEEDYDFARALESGFNFDLSFFDCMHIAMSKRLGCILVTREKLLIEKAKNYIAVDKPENLSP